MPNGSVPVGTKTCIPRLSPLLVARPRLHDLLDSDTRPQVTLVCGPPGAGKTTLLASALGSPNTQGRVSWLCLDERDNQPERLGALLRSALSNDSCAAARPTSTRPLSDLLDSLFDRLPRGDTRQVLVLDDVHALRSPAALAALSHLVLHAPEQLDVVLASRADPLVGLEQLRLDGRLGEVRNADLAFNPTEAAELLAIHDVSLAPDDARALWRCTEGWAAGLRLAACALQTDPDPARFVRRVTRTETVMSDYLLRELLVHKDDAAQWFLLRTSVADRLTPELAELLSEDPRSPEHLEDLARSGVVIADRDAQSYRYHALFGTLLQARLRRHDPDLTRDLHGRVARWCLAHDLPSEAQQHFHAAEDWAMLGRLLAWRWLDATLDGQSTASEPPPAGLEPTVLRETPGLALVAAADACRRANQEQAEVYRDIVDGLLTQTEPARAPDGPGRDVDSIVLDRPDMPVGDIDGTSSWDTERLVIDVTFASAFGSDERAQRACEALAQTSSDDPAAPALRRFAALRGAELALDTGDLETARGRLADLADQSDTCWVSVEAAAFLALLDAASGLIEPAAARSARVVEDRRGCATAKARHAARLASVLCLAQQGELRTARSTMAETAGHPDDLASLLLRLVDRVVSQLLMPPARPSGPATVDASSVEHPFASLVLTALGAVEVTGVEAPGAVAVTVGGPGEQAVAQARHHAAAGDLVLAAKVVTAWLDDETHTAHPRTLVEALTIAAIGADERQDHGLALRRLGDALDHASTTGILAPLLQHGPRLTRLLDRHLSELGDQRGSAIRLLDRLRPTGLGDPVDPLTDREIEVLVCLPALMSNAEIADGLHLSINTVKTHLKAVYRKLGVDGRRQAVVRGRELELI